MRYSGIDEFEIVNGKDIGVSFYTQGCYRHCKGCFNEAAWDLDGGMEYTTDVRDKIVNLWSRAGIKRFSIVGGEPLLERNREEIMALCSLVKKANPDIKNRVYNGNVYEAIKDKWLEFFQYYVDVLVDGPFILDQRDITLPFRGSSNQRSIGVRKSIIEGKVVGIND